MNPEIKILIVDELSTMRRILRGLLEGIGLHEITDMDYGQDLISSLKSDKVDILILDFSEQGRHLLDLIRKQQTLDALRILVIGPADKESELLDLSDGNIRYLTKPVNVQNLSEKLELLSAGDEG